MMPPQLNLWPLIILCALGGACVGLLLSIFFL